MTEKRPWLLPAIPPPTFTLSDPPALAKFPVGSTVRLVPSARKFSSVAIKLATGVVLDAYEGQFCVKVLWPDLPRVEHVDYLEKVS